MWYPIQVKQQDKVRRPDIDRFEAVMTREDRPIGFFVAFGFTSGAVREADAFTRRTKQEIRLLTVQEILSEEKVTIKFGYRDRWLCAVDPRPPAQERAMHSPGAGRSR